MPMAASKSLRFFEFSSFPKDHIDHGIFTRKGGVSPKPWKSLNLGGLNGDSRENVIENRQKIFEAFERPVESIFDVWQVHSADVICAESPRLLDAPHKKADAIVTNRPNITLFMRFADCVPVFFYDPEKKVVAIAHAGWQGTVKDIVGHTVRNMQDQYGCLPENIFAGIGPSIGPDHYEVNNDVIEHVQNVLGEQSKTVFQPKNGRYMLDLWKTNQILLERAGIKNIEVAGICTACHMNDWYSHRGEHGITGRFGALLALKMRDTH